MNSAPERGSVTLFVAISVAALLVMVGLVVDGGGKVRAAQRASRVAAEAGRAAGQQLDVPGAMQGRALRVLVGPAVAAAQDHLSTAQVEGQVQVSADGRRIVVEVSTSEPTRFLGLIGISELTAHGSAQVELVAGVVTEE